ncbi:MAG: RidA family protein [Chloroflexota bacterium]
MKIEARLEELGLVLPEPFRGPEGLQLPFLWVRMRGNRAYLAGHGPEAVDGSITGPFGKVGADVTIEQAYASARLTALAMLGNLKRELGDLDRVTAWLRVFGMVNCAPGFNQTTRVINGFSDLIVELYGSEAGKHARAAIGVAELPFNMPVEIEAEVEIA